MVLLAGCGKKEAPQSESSVASQGLIGTWKYDAWESGYTFREDGTGRDLFWKQDFTYYATRGTLVLTYNEGLWAEKEYLYLIEGNTLTLAEVPEPAEGETAMQEFTFAEDGSLAFDGEIRVYTKVDDKN